VWLAKVTGRSLILPNLLGSSDIVTVEKHDNHNMWPGFRVSKFKKEKGKTVIQVEVLEPGEYRDRPCHHIVGLLCVTKNF
jgi:hypothetical protein